MIVINDDPSALAQALLEQVNNLAADLASHTHGGIATGAGSTGVADSTLTAETITLRV